MNDMWAQPLPDTTETELRADLERLDRMLRESVPGHADARTDVTLDASVPDYVRLFWEVLGHTPRMTVEPLADPEENQRLLQRGVAYLKEMARSPLTLSDLPKRCHFVQLVEHDPYGMIFTDDTQSPVDPPLYIVGARRKRFELLRRSYVRSCTDAMISLAINDWLQGGLRISFATDPEPVFNVLVPGCFRLDPDLWIDPGYGSAGDMRRLACRNTSALIEHAIDTPFEDHYLPMELGCDVGAVVELADAELAVLEPLAAAKRWQTQPPIGDQPITCAAGHIEDIPVLVAEHVQPANRVKLAVLVDKSSTARLEAIIRSKLPGYTTKVIDRVGEMPRNRRQIR